MTSTASSVNTTPRKTGRLGRWFVPSLYRTELRRTWSHGLLYAIILFFAIPVVVMMGINDTGFYANSPARVLRFIESYFTSENPLATLYALANGVFSALFVTGYLFDRRKTHFVCSLPVSREGYFFTRCAANLTWSVLAWVPAGVLLAIVVAFKRVMIPYFAETMAGFFSLFITWLGLYLFFYGLTLLAASMCGTGVMSGCMFLMFAGYLSLALVAVVLMITLYLPSFVEEYYLSEAIFERISGVVRIFMWIAEPKGAPFLISSAAIGLLYIGLAALLIRIRKSELAGNHFVFGAVRDTVKVLLMILCALYGGMLFQNMAAGWGYPWLLFGCACGAILCWMLTNTIFYKTPKMMFTGKRAMVATMVACALFLSFASFDVFRLNSYIPSTGITRSVTLDLGMPVRVTRPELIRIYNAMAENGEKLSDSRYSFYSLDNALSYRFDLDSMQKNRSDGEDEGEVRLMTDRFRTVWQTKLLLPVAKRTRVSYVDWATFARAVVREDDFAKLYFTQIRADLHEEMKISPEMGDWTNLHISDPEYPPYSAGFSPTATAWLSFIDVYEAEMREMGEGAMQKRLIGYIHTTINDEGYTLPLFDGYEKTYGALQLLVDGAEDGEVTIDNTEAYYKYEDENGDVQVELIDTGVSELERTFTKAVLYHKGAVVTALSQEEIQEMLEDGILAGTGSVLNASPFTVVDTEWCIDYTVECKEYYKTYDGRVEVNTYTDENHFLFLDGMVPVEYTK